MIINHRIIPLLIKNNFFNDINSFDEFIEKTVKYGKEQKKLVQEHFSVINKKYYDKNKEKIEHKCQQRYNTIVGDIFEVFSQAYLTFYGAKYKISDIEFSTKYLEKDFGVDAYGKDNIDNDIVGIQCKFRSNKEYNLEYRELATFLAACTTGSGNKELKVKDSNHIIIITTCNGLNDTAIKAFNYDGHVRVIGYKEIYKETMSDMKFWESLRSIENLQTKPKNNFQLYDFQQSIVTNFKNKLLSDQLIKTSYILPTASGKSIIQASIIDETIKNNGSIIVTVAPSIELVNQLGYTYEGVIQNNIKPYIVSSEGRKNSNGVQEIENSTSTLDIIEKIIESKVNELPIVISSTYKSFDKIVKALEELDFSIDLVCFDEAHHSTKTEFFNTLSDGISSGIIKNRLFFTATPSISEVSNEIQCMNNEDIYGEKYIITMKTMVEKGFLCKALLSFINGGGYLDKSQIKIIKEIIEKRCTQLNNVLDNTEVISYTVDEIISILYAIEKTTVSIRGFKNNTIDCKIIISCASVTKAHLLAIILNDILKLINNDIFKEEWFIDAVSSDSGLTKNYSILYSREKAISQFKKAGNGILCHYDVLSEGVDIPQCSRVIPLRGMCNRIIVQTLGRTLRRVPNDILLLKENYNSPTFSKLLKDDTKWEKPYGGMIIPIYGDSENIKNIIDDILSKLLKAGIDFVPENIEYHTCGETDIDCHSLRKLTSDIKDLILENIDNFDLQYNLTCDTQYYKEEDVLVKNLLNSYLKINKNKQ